MPIKSREIGENHDKLIKNIVEPIYLYHISCRDGPIHDISVSSLVYANKKL